MFDILNKYKKTAVLSYYTILHCLVDFCCIYYMFKIVMSISIMEASVNWLFYVVMYNFLAFAGQLPIGIIGDFIKRDHHMVMVGIACLLLAYGGTLWRMPIFPTVLLLGIGNGCFHVGGGIEAMEYDDRSFKPVGIFVSTGAFGVFGGKWFSSYELSLIPIITIILIALLALQIVLCLKFEDTNKERRHCLSFKPKSGGVSFIFALCCISVVVIRSFAGVVFRFSWSTGILAFLMTVGIVMGKMMGGVLADKFGAGRTVVLSLSFSAVLFIGAESIPVMGLLAVFLFNMTMPITLSLLGTHFKMAKGTMFGALTFAIFIGLIPSYFCRITKYSLTPVYIILTLLSLALLYAPFIFEKYREKRKLKSVENLCDG